MHNYHLETGKNKPANAVNVGNDSDTPMSLDHLPPLLTVKDAARLFRCSTKTVRRLYESGAIAYVHPRGYRKVLITRDSFLKFIGMPIQHHVHADSAASAIEEGGER